MAGKSGGKTRKLVRRQKWPSPLDPSACLWGTTSLWNSTASHQSAQGMHVSTMPAVAGEGKEKTEDNGQMGDLKKGAQMQHLLPLPPPLVLASGASLCCAARPVETHGHTGMYQGERSRDRAESGRQVMAAPQSDAVGCEHRMCADVSLPLFTASSLPPLKATASAAIPPFLIHLPSPLHAHACMRKEARARRMKRSVRWHCDQSAFNSLSLSLLSLSPPRSHKAGDSTDTKAIDNAD